MAVFILLCAGSAAARAGSLRIISLAPATTEILFALGLDEEIVAVSSFCDYPEKARSKEKAGSFSRPNVEKIISLKPDIIFCAGLEQDFAVVELRRLGMNVVVSDPVTMDELYASIVEIGGLTGRTREAKNIVRGMSDEITGVRSLLSKSPVKKPRVFVEIWHSPLMTAGKGSYLDDLLSLAGGDNIAADTVRPYSYFSVEQVLARDPECILLAYMDDSDPVQKLVLRTGWQRISAVKNKRVFNDIDPDLILRPGPRAARGVKELYKRLYP